MKVKVAFFEGIAEKAPLWNCWGIYYCTAGSRLSEGNYRVSSKPQDDLLAVGLDYLRQPALSFS